MRLLILFFCLLSMNSKAQVTLDPDSPAKKDFGRMTMLLRMYGTYPEKEKKIKAETYEQLKQSFDNCKAKEPSKDWSYYENDINVLLSYYEKGIRSQFLGELKILKKDGDGMSFRYTLPSSILEITSKHGVENDWPQIFYLKGYAQPVGSNTQIPLTFVAKPNSKSDSEIDLVVIPSNGEMESEWFKDIDWVYDSHGELISTVNKSLFSSNLKELSSASNEKGEMIFVVSHGLGDGKTKFYAQTDKFEPLINNATEKQSNLENEIMLSTKIPERKGNQSENEKQLAGLVQMNLGVKVKMVLSTTPDDSPVKSYTVKNELIQEKWYYAVIYEEKQSCWLKYYFYTLDYNNTSTVSKKFHESKGEAKELDCAKFEQN